MIKPNPQQYNNDTPLGIYNLGLEIFTYVYCSSLRMSLIYNGKSVSAFNVTTSWYYDFF